MGREGLTLERSKEKEEKERKRKKEKDERKARWPSRAAISRKIQ